VDRKGVVMIEPTGQRRDEIINTALEAIDTFRKLSKSMNNYERLFFCNTLIAGVTATRDKFQEYCDEGYGEETA
jgi:hypothetical protein